MPKTIEEAVTNHPEFKKLSKLIVLSNLLNISPKLIVTIWEEKDEETKAISEILIRNYDKYLCSTKKSPTK